MIHPDLYASPSDDHPAPVVAYAGEQDRDTRNQAHCHRRAQLFHLVSGSVTVETDQGSFVVPPERALWMPSGVVHATIYHQRTAQRFLYFRPEAVPHLPRTPSVIRLSPLLRELILAFMVPAIDDAGTVLWESNVIVRYLAASRGRTDLLPVEPAARARIKSWMDWQASDFNNSWPIAFQGLVRRNPEYQDPVVIGRSTAAFSAFVAIVDGELGRTGGYVAGDAFTVADIAIGLSIHRWLSTPFDKPVLARVERYYERLCERPGFRRYGRDGGP